ncbi:glycosyltransferase [Protaetiibacter larvae]|uniref:Glycosyltransferase n=1 Tax=Protaetiibacter larvae TaxID=2592654 RepID=A0A5C1Y7H2_9MICO|nr:glycosyltransferase [Protaetiibacter larvae]QEO09756.1 glycosyltransferase [Protaetiibacter larvae]
MTRYGFVSTYPPTRCGLATFTEALASAIPRPRDPDSRVIRVDDLVPTGPATPGPRTVVVGGLRPGRPDERAAAAEALDACDVVILQHEFGIYGGRDGDEVLDLLARIAVPTIVVLHTVREVPTAHQRWLIERIAAHSSAVVVMTRMAERVLSRSYDVDGAKVHVIPHGVADMVRTSSAAPGARPRILTWGLLGPGKGIEWGIRALAELTEPGIRPVYDVSGQTHPKVLAESGEAYRDSLGALARQLGVEADVVIDGRYRDRDELAELVAGAAIVLLPYTSREQSTSGVLAEAVAAGRPVISTRFPHAVELLSGGAGVLVAHENPQEIAAAVRTILGRRNIAERMTTAALESSQTTGWDAVAEDYQALGTELLRAAAA